VIAHEFNELVKHSRFLSQAEIILTGTSQRGQVAMREVLGAALKRIDRDAEGVPVRLFRYTRPSKESALSSMPPLKKPFLFIDRSFGKLGNYSNIVSAES